MPCLLWRGSEATRVQSPTTTPTTSRLMNYNHRTGLRQSRFDRTIWIFPILLPAVAAQVLAEPVECRRVRRFRVSLEAARARRSEHLLGRATSVVLHQLQFRLKVQPMVLRVPLRPKVL